MRIRDALKYTDPDLDADLDSRPRYVRVPYL
jgi:hypothetical protein